MNCKACRIEIEGMETSQPLSVEARAHAETCLPCRTVRDEHLTLRRLLGSLEAVSAPPDFDFRLRARLADNGRESNRRFTWQRFAPHVSLVWVVASLVLVMAVAVAYRQVWLNRPQATGQAEVINQAPVNVEAARTAAASNSNRPEESSVAVNAGAQDHSSESTLTTGGEPDNRNSTRSLRGRIFSAAARRDLVASDSGNQGIISSDSAVHNPPPLITPTGVNNPAVDPVPSIALPVRSSAQPMIFFLNGWDGASRPVSLKTVTFGSERLIDLNEGARAISSDDSDIW